MMRRHVAKSINQTCSAELYFWGNMEGNSFPRVFERRNTFLYLGEFYKEFERYVKKKGLVNRQLFP
jgi:hypothetical protein